VKGKRSRRKGSLGGIMRPGEGGGSEESQEEWSGWGWWPCNFFVGRRTNW